jgi:predicted metalloendopeptidase
MPLVSSSTIRIRWAALACCVACASQVTAPLAPSSSPQAAEGTAPPKPQFGNWGFDSDGMDRSVAPGSSFYRYANGHWLATTPIPPDKSNYGLFTVSNRLVTDPHSPSEFRSAVVRNLDPWYTAFTPAPADALFLASEQRVRIW